jgi:integrase-like protein
VHDVCTAPLRPGRLGVPIQVEEPLEAENVALRHQLIVLWRKVQGRVRLTNNDRWFFIQLYRWFPSILQALTIIRPDKPTAPASPWQNGFAERLIGSIRRECVDHFVVLGEAHLRRILRAYARYYNDVRTHRSLDKDAPVSRPVQRTGIISSHAILGGLHHHYVRV